MLKYIENNSTNSKYNLALEEYAFRSLDTSNDYILLWRNEPSIIIGKNQCTVEEINSEYVAENNINVVRRITGGGAVYHDLGNLNFSFITSINKIEEIDFKAYTYPVVHSLEKLGVKCEISGRNDITISTKKFSGIAQSISKGRLLNHGTLLFNSELDALGKALNVKSKKIESKGVKSVRSRVTNISDYLSSSIGILEFRDIVLQYLFQYYDSQINRYYLSDEDKTKIDELVKNKYSTWEWNYGKSPKFNYKNLKKFSAGILEAKLYIEDGCISSCKINGDFFSIDDVSEFERIMIGLKYNKNSINEALKSIDISRYFGNIPKNDFVNLFFE